MRGLKGGSEAFDGGAGATPYSNCRAKVATAAPTIAATTAQAVLLLFWDFALASMEGTGAWA